jgi:hypothetical protein
MQMAVWAPDLAAFAEAKARREKFLATPPPRSGEEGSNYVIVNVLRSGGALERSRVELHWAVDVRCATCPS